MTDNELIEAAAKAILDANGIRPDDPDGDHGYYAQTWKYAIQDAEAALTVFEKAHAPTDAATEVAPELEVPPEHASGIGTSAGRAGMSAPPAPICPECIAGKCRACSDLAIDCDDNLTGCTCTHERGA